MFRYNAILPPLRSIREKNINFWIFFHEKTAISYIVDETEINTEGGITSIQ